MSHPLVSVLMPTRNRPRYASLCVQMFMAQTYGPRELIIIEDGENDLRSWLFQKFGILKTSAGMLKRLVKCGEVTTLNIKEGVQIHYLRFEGTTGAKLNKGATVAQGEYLIRFDDDDWQSPNRIDQQVEHFRMSGKSLIGLTSIIFYREGLPHGWEWWGNGNDPLGASQAFRRDWLLSNPIPDKTIGEDTAIAKIAREQGELFALSGKHDVLVSRDHDSNTGKRSEEDFREHPNCESYLKTELSDWYGNIVRPWVDNPVERQPIVRVPKTDWSLFAEKVNTHLAKQ